MKKKRRKRESDTGSVVLFFVREVLYDVIFGDGFGALQGHAQGTVPEDLREGPHGTGDPEQHRVVGVVLEAVVP